VQCSGTVGEDVPDDGVASGEDDGVCWHGVRVPRSMVATPKINSRPASWGTGLTRCPAAPMALLLHHPTLSLELLFSGRSTSVLAPPHLFLSPLAATHPTTSAATSCV
jgi:hypothetical protein